MKAYPLLVFSFRAAISRCSGRSWRGLAAGLRKAQDHALYVAYERGHSLWTVGQVLNGIAQVSRPCAGQNGAVFLRQVLEGPGGGDVLGHDGTRGDAE